MPLTTDERSVSVNKIVNTPFSTWVVVIKVQLDVEKYDTWVKNTSKTESGENKF